MSSSSIVIKVKYGETLRRINVTINDKKLVLDMVMLKKTIRSLFNLSSDVEFTMTYVDEDGDIVTLADDNDLHDVVRQSLNPLRISVSLINSNNFDGPALVSAFQTLNFEVPALEINQYMQRLEPNQLSQQRSNQDKLWQMSHGLGMFVFSHVAACINKLINVSGSSSGWLPGMINATNQFVFTAMRLINDAISQGHKLHFPINPHWNRNGLDNNGMVSIFHSGVRCDGCGAHPITEPRFKSKVKVSYNLCNVCFKVKGNATDYIRMDQPVNDFMRNIQPKEVYDPSLYAPLATLPHAMQALRSKLDSQAVLDVSWYIITIMAPSTVFTKVWRIRNNGSISWPYGSQLRWIKGERLSVLDDSVDVKIPVDGLPVGWELEIAVDFTAPKLPGRYASYWRMVSPSGELFGQTVWVLIQVKEKNLDETLINLTLPPVMNDLKAVNQDQSDPITYPTVDLSVMPLIMSTSAAPPPTAVVLPMSKGATSLPKVVVPLLNSKVVVPQMDSFVVPPSSSGGVLEWDQMLDELQEMGFIDVEANKRLLKKHNGSIKLVVVELINEENKVATVLINDEKA
ncbi:hypothetical protein QVD17_25422 [Tagetes erecta]|uniref:Uncharacterized protein n=1 Tax=Tagetes erecta TaxID=13708 RepID=A0AAD8NVG6_TARER|nr:hypothetical protein QVD17_25422 [Tagetes erecta]